jgi:apolipoprotein D and lipocalin family protein
MVKTRAYVAVVLLLITFYSLIGCASGMKSSQSGLQVVPGVDLARYAGTWYEIASYPNSFQKGCVGTKATYNMRDDGKISVVNECFRGSFEGKHSIARGTARIADSETNAKLKVTFFWPFYGDYWIIDLGENYDYAVVGHPAFKYLWILSRTPRMDGSVYQSILKRLEAKSYDTGRLVKTIQR